MSKGNLKERAWFARAFYELGLSDWYNSKEGANPATYSVLISKVKQHDKQIRVVDYAIIVLILYAK